MSSSLSKYQRMLAVGLPEAVVEQRMQVDGVPAEAIGAFFGLSGPVATPAPAPRPTTRYEKMLSAGHTQAVVEQRMLVDGVPPLEVRNHTLCGVPFCRPSVPCTPVCLSGYSRSPVHRILSSQSCDARRHIHTHHVRRCPRSCRACRLWRRLRMLRRPLRATRRCCASATRLLLLSSACWWIAWPPKPLCRSLAVLG